MATLEERVTTLEAQMLEVRGKLGLIPTPPPLPNPTPPPVPSPVPVLPITGTLFDLPSTNPNHIPGLLDEAKLIGCTEILLQYTRRKQSGTGCGNGSFDWVNGAPGVIGTFLDEAGKRGIKVTVGLSLSCDVCIEFTNQPNRDLAVKDCINAAKFINDSYGNHPAFLAWYIPDEPALPWNTPEVYDYYKRIVQGIRIFSSKPIGFSPDLTWISIDKTKTPAAVATLAKNFVINTGIDYLAFQDSVGATCTNLGWDRPSTYTTKDYYDALQGAIGNKCYGIIELFNGALNGQPIYDTAHGAYKACSGVRLARQLELAKDLPKRFVFIAQAHLSNNGQQEGRRLLAFYLARYAGKGSLIFPASYKYVQATLHPDNNDRDRHLFNNVITGDAKNYKEPRWVGLNGDSVIEVDLGSVKHLDYVSIHFGQFAAAAIRYPLSVNLSIDGANAGNFNFPFSGGVDAEYVWANPNALNKTGRILTISIKGGAPWTFLSQIELCSTT